MIGKIRLQVALAQQGFASRRAAVEIIKAGRVKVNGKAVREPGCRVNPEKDAITVDGKKSCVQKKVYFLLNKPDGVVTTVRDRHSAQTVLELVKQKDARIYPVGRLDRDTTGLLLLTNDGDLAYRLTHPKFGIKKVYHVRITRNGLSNSDIDAKIKKLEAGILLEGKKTFPCEIGIVSGTKKIVRLNVMLFEGRKRQIKKMFAAVGHPVLSIERTAFGPLKLARLKTGQWRKLKPSEVAELNKAIGRR
jgi:23S rRNA pseudouridine2605 synthase